MGPQTSEATDVPLESKDQLLQLVHALKPKAGPEVELLGALGTQSFLRWGLI